MKFKEELNLDQVVFFDNIEKILDLNTVNTCLELEETLQEYWNIDRKTANFINLILKIKKPELSLEIGTSNGYSAIWIAKALQKNKKGKLITIEYWQKRVDLALDNFKKTEVDKIITPITGDAVKILENMKQENKLKFDFIFVDANKAEYIQYFNSFDHLLNEGGIIIADNILSHYKKTKDYVSALYNHPNYQSQLLNIDAGILFSCKL